MKNIMMKIAGLVLMMVFLVSSCMEDPIKDAQEKYDYNKIIPKVLDGIQGPAVAIQTFTGDYTINYFRGGSTWNWSATNATVQKVSEDKRTATILFGTYPPNGKATITVTETTQGGITSDPVSKEVTVQKYCPLANGAASLVGEWDGTDGQGDYTYPSTISTSVSGTKLLVSGINVGFMNDFWAESIVSGGTCLMTVNVNGTLEIPEQYFCDTDYSNGYKIKGTGTWDNCGSKPTLTINYDVWYPDGNYWISVKYAANLGGKAFLTAAITLK